MKKKPNRRLDFLPNVQNKYSIRKFTAGAASILVGATLIFGAGQEEAKAAESDQAVTGQENTSSVTDTTNQQSTEEKEVSDSTETNQQSQEAKEVTNNTETSQQLPEAKEVTDNTETSQQSPEAKEAPKSDSTETDQPSPEETPKSDSTETNQPSPEEAPKSDSTETDQPSPEEAPKSDSTETDQPSPEEAPKSDSTETNQPSPEEAPKSESTETNQPSPEEAPKSDSTETDQPSTKEAPKSDSTEIDQPSPEEAPKSESTETNQPSTKEAPKSESTETNQPSLDKQETTSDVTEQPEASASIQNISEELNVSSDDTVQALENIGVDTSNASEAEAMAALIQNDYANNNEETPVATTTNINTATARNNETTNILRARVLAATNNNVSSTNNNRIIEADALANGYIKKSIDATNAANTLSGRAWIVDKGTPATTLNGLTPVPEGTSVYMQWIDKDGVESPIYKAATTNSLSKSDTSQVGPGAYAFDLREPFIDENGKEHKYRASNDQRYRIWIDDFKTEGGNTATMLRVAGGYLPGKYVDSVTANNMGQFPFIGVNMQRTGIFMAVKPEGNYMTKPENEWIHDEKGADRPLSRNSIHGRVWLETGENGDQANSATGPNYNPLISGDRAAQGYTVVFSSLTDEGVQAYGNQIKGLPTSKQADAVKQLLTEHPEYISATVYGETNDKGYYTIHFPNDIKINNDYIYGYVLDPDGERIEGYSSFTSPLFHKAGGLLGDKNTSWTPQPTPVEKPLKHGWYNVNFALIPHADTPTDKADNEFYEPTTEDITKDYGTPTTDKEVTDAVTVPNYPSDKGTPTITVDDPSKLPDGNTPGTVEVPVTVTYPDDTQDHVTVTVTTKEQADNDAYEPTTEDITKDYGTPTTEEDVTGAVTVPNYPSDKGTPTITVDDPNTLPDGNTPGTEEVPVTVTYPDDTEDHVTVTVTTKEEESKPHEDGHHHGHGDNMDPEGTNKDNNKDNTNDNNNGNPNVNDNNNGNTNVNDNNNDNTNVNDNNNDNTNVNDNNNGNPNVNDNNNGNTNVNDNNN
ncbi:Rib/alpha-like domain-containing protein, partial [Staphylococcus hominis]|uniref:Rib/alpha-like domain-containing protein n=1 Tax=Staphylococcus hominis TaxID=1290 RepID=UPI000D43A9C7